MIRKIGLVAAIIMPLWNIPLIMKIVKRKSSKDISLYWALGFGFVWRVFNIMNFIFFRGHRVVVWVKEGAN